MEASREKWLDVGDLSIKTETVDDVKVVGSQLVSCRQCHQTVIGRDKYFDIALLVVGWVCRCLVASR